MRKYTSIIKVKVLYAKYLIPEWFKHLEDSVFMSKQHIDDA